jgi:hypothetical protein
LDALENFTLSGGGEVVIFDFMGEGAGKRGAEGRVASGYMTCYVVVRDVLHVMTF